MANGKWHISGYERDDAVALVHGGFNPLVAVILASRGISAPEDAERSLESGVSPFLIPC